MFVEMLWLINIARITNDVQCHSLLSSHNGCNVFLNVRNVYNFTNVTSIFDGSLKVFSKCQVIFSPHSDLIKSKSKVTSSLKDYSLMIFSKCLCPCWSANVSKVTIV